MKSSRSFHFVLAVALTSGVAIAQIGTTYCAANVNSSGSISNIFATGSTVVTDCDLTLGCDNLPPSTFGYFITSRTQGFVTNPGGSAGNLCLGVGVGRYAGDVLSSGTTGAVSLVLDLNAIPSPAGSTMVAFGDTVNFQFWHRDAGTTGATSNFSEGLEVQFDAALLVPTMVSIPAGSFSMGSNAGPGAPYFAQVGEQPVHMVTITQDFWMGATEITQEEYQAFMGTTPSYFQGSDFPVEQVSWDDAREYCALLTTQQSAAGLIPGGFEYRLPTEAEWEYSCRAGTTTEFNVGAGLFCGQARFGYSHHSNTFCPLMLTVAVGSHAPNAWGLYDMHGNVFEWCLDDLDNYTDAPQIDPFVSGTLFPMYPVIRGGAWLADSDFCRSATRLSAAPSGRHSSLGFRVVLAPVIIVP